MKLTTQRGVIMAFLARLTSVQIEMLDRIGELSAGGDFSLSVSDMGTLGPFLHTLQSSGLVINVRTGAGPAIWRVNRVLYNAIARQPEAIKRRVARRFGVSVDALSDLSTESRKLWRAIRVSMMLIYEANQPGMNQIELGRLFGCSQPTVSRYGQEIGGCISKDSDLCRLVNQLRAEIGLQTR